MAFELSILDSTKKILSVDPSDDSFDQDIITHINMAFSHLHQLGVGPANGFVIDDESKDWAEFLPAPQSGTEAAALYLSMLSAIKTNVYLRVRLIFDPPAVSYVLAALEQQLTESDSRISMLREATDWVDPDPPNVTDLVA